MCRSFYKGRYVYFITYCLNNSQWLWKMWLCVETFLMLKIKSNFGIAGDFEMVLVVLIKFDGINKYPYQKNNVINDWLKKFTNFQILFDSLRDWLIFSHFSTQFLFKTLVRWKLTDCEMTMFFPAPFNILPRTEDRL